MSNIEDYFQKDAGRFDKKPGYPILFKCTIPTSEYKKALYDLELMRISSLTMYNDMEGLVKYKGSELDIYFERFRVS